MRKLLTGVLSVAGLFSVVLALAAPAGAARAAVSFTTANVAGTYTVSWETFGDCQPGPGSSGPSGSVSATLPVTNAAATPPTGSPQTIGVNIDTICSYEWTARLVRTDGVECKVTVGTITSGRSTLTVTPASDCDKLVNLAVTVAPYSRAAVAANPAATPPVAAVTAIAAKEPDIGAVRATVFTVTATPVDESGVLGRALAPPPPVTTTTVQPSASADRGSGGIGTQTPPAPPIASPNRPEGRQCKAVSGTTKVDGAGANKVTLKVVGGPYSLLTHVCSYLVRVTLPPGFVAGDGSGATAAADRTIMTPCRVTANASDCNVAAATTLKVSVAQRRVLLVQNVVGDARDGRASYRYSSNCGPAGLPPALGVNSGQGGVVRNPDTTTVELRTGRFNISVALSPTATDSGVRVLALNSAGQACVATVSVSGLPAHCSVESASQTVNLATLLSSQAIIEFMIDCSPPPPPAPPPPPPPPPPRAPATTTDEDLGADPTPPPGPQAMGDTG